MNCELKKIDILEQEIVDFFGGKLLETLLLDRTSGANIVWATDDYARLGDAYAANRPILPELITGAKTRIIQPRTTKAQSEQTSRTRKKAEVFTPSWICNAQNNLVDEAWFDRKDVFNTTKGTTWKRVDEPILFPDKKRTWKSYVDARRMEITCGEAPYLVSRYDAVTGRPIPVPNRIGLLDRKLRVVVENTNDDDEWRKWSQRAFQSVYGYEFQGDNLLLARENLLYTYADYTLFYRKRAPTTHEMEEIAKIISWNLWQMDGTTYTIPYGKVKEKNEQPTFFDFMAPEKEETFTTPCRIKDWRARTVIDFRSLLSETRR